MDLSQFLTLNNLPTGRRLFAHREVIERADKSTMKDVVAHVKKSIKHDEETLQVELSRRGAPVARLSTDATRLDVLLDRSITGLAILRRRPVVDVNPDTGEPDLPANDEPEPDTDN